jgi:2-iminobutanoate/2-iminopropanoate deaminase
MTDMSKPPISPIRRAGNLLFLSGQLGFDADRNLAMGDIAAQTRQVIANIVAVLATEGATLNDVVKATVWITDKAHFAAYNAVYAEAFGNAAFPARSTVVSGLVAEGALIEIEVIAQVG